MAAMTVEEAMAVVEELAGARSEVGRAYWVSKLPKALATLRDAAADARRYRWLRDAPDIPLVADELFVSDGAEFDAIIDAAMGEQQ